MESIRRSLATHRKKMISISELETLTKPYLKTYDAFADSILNLEDEGILSMVKSKGRTTRTPSLALQYRIHKNLLTKDYHLELQQHRRLIHSSINLDWYYGKDPSIWKKDLPSILKINDYLKKNAFPGDVVPAPERSFELVGDDMQKENFCRIISRLSIAAA